MKKQASKHNPEAWLFDHSNKYNPRSLLHTHTHTHTQEAGRQRLECYLDVLRS